LTEKHFGNVHDKGIVDITFSLEKQSYGFLGESRDISVKDSLQEPELVPIQIATGCISPLIFVNPAAS
jgi:hypothetical protein